MTGHDDRWTTSDLELFHDEQLESDRSAGLSEDLCRDAALRTRLAQVRRVDEVVRTVLLHPRPARSIPGIPHTRGIAAATVLLVVSGAIALLVLGRAPQAPIPASASGPAPKSPSIRVVFSLPVNPTRNHAIQGLTAVGDAASRTKEKAFLGQVSRALAAGQVDETLELLAEAPFDQKRAAYRHLAELVRSARVAESILDSLEPDEQLAACTAWVWEPPIRPVVFARLQRLSQKASMAKEVHGVLEEFSAEPALRAWVCAYQLDQRS